MGRLGRVGAKRGGEGGGRNSLPNTDSIILVIWTPKRGTPIFGETQLKSVREVRKALEAKSPEPQAPWISSAQRLSEAPLQHKGGG